jgi:hypothetical protein
LLFSGIDYELGWLLHGGPFWIGGVFISKLHRAQVVTDNLLLVVEQTEVRTKVCTRQLVRAFSQVIHRFLSRFY